MKEVISIHLGQGGIQVGNSCWELFCLEHGIKFDGSIIEKDFEKDNEAVRTFFSESPDGEHFARAIHIDLDPQIVDEYRQRPKGKIYKSEYLISGNQNASNNFARGYYTLGKEIIDVFLDRIRKQAEECQNLQGFLIYHSVGGGTGSGFESLLLERLSKDYEKEQKLTFSIYPSKYLSSSFVEPYNSILTTSSLNSYSDATVVFDNEALYNICMKKLDIESPKLMNLNCVIAQVISQLTASIRFDGALNNSLKEFIENTVVCPQAKFLAASYSPLQSTEKPAYEYPSVAEITNDLFQADNMMIKCDPQRGKYLTCNIQYRGDVIPKYVSSALAEIKTKKTIQFVDWCTKGFKVGINYTNPKTLPESQIINIAKTAYMIANQTFMLQFFKHHSLQFDAMFEKRAFVHWYTSEGMEEAEFQKAREDVQNMCSDYEEMESNEVDQ